MDLTQELLGCLAAATRDYGPTLPRPELLELAALGLFVRIGRTKVEDVPQGQVLSAEILAGLDAYQQSIAVACLSGAPDLARAAQGVAKQWLAGTFPALAAACGDDSKLAGREQLEVTLPGGSRVFDVLLSPVLERGQHDAPGQLARPETFVMVVAGPLSAARLNAQNHWVECFAQRSGNGAREVSCRLDSKDWPDGSDLLRASIDDWPGQTKTFHSRRQFFMLTPAADEPELPRAEARPGLLGRLFGRR